MHNTKDALACIVLRPGMVFRPKVSFDGDEVTGQILLVVANLKWGLLVWPLKMLDGGSLQLASPGALEWYFTISCDHQDVSHALPVLTDIGVVAEPTCWEHSANAMLRNYWTELTFGDLCAVASLVGLKDPRKVSRAELLKSLALHVGDQDLADTVQAKEGKGKKKATDAECEDEGFDSDDSLAELLLDNMDGPEVDDFKQLKQRVNARHAVNKKRKWSQWRKEAEEVSQLLISFLWLVFLFFFVLFCACELCSNLNHLITA